MKRSAVCLFVTITVGALVSTAHAAGTAAKGDKAGDKASSDAADSAAGGAAPAPDAAGADTGAAGVGTEGTDALDLSDKGDKGTEEAGVKPTTSLSWQDIVVVPRKAFLKGGRFEFAPFTGVSVNDILIRHYVFGLDLNYFMTDVLWVGLQGNYYIKALTDRESLVGLQYNRIPTLNKYKYGAAINFGYVPVYGKFAWFNSSIIHWEIFASGGVGVTQTEVIPRNATYDSFTNTSITPNVALGGRFFLFDWLTLNYAVRDYIVLDKFEPANRGQLDGNGNPLFASAASAKANADGRLVQNVMFYLGVGVYLPTKFQYKSPR